MTTTPRTRGTPDPAESPDQLVTEIEAVRENLADTIDTLVERVHPKTIASRTAAGVKSKFVDSNGSPRLDTIGGVVGGVALFVGVVFVIRKLVND